MVGAHFPLFFLALVHFMFTKWITSIFTLYWMAILLGTSLCLPAKLMPNSAQSNSVFAKGEKEARAR
jgi:hypothetical protein